MQKRQPAKLCGVALKHNTPIEQKKETKHIIALKKVTEQIG